MNQASLVFVSLRNSFAQNLAAIPEYNNIELSQKQQIIDILIDRRPALIFIDGQHDQWRMLTLASKTNAATRRIPVCFVSDEGDNRAEAIACGADLALSWTELRDRIRQIVSDLARIPDAAVLEQLECDCQQKLPSLAIDGVKAFNQGEFYRQHDLFEEQWVKTAGPVRDLYRAILQVGVAYYQIERGNYRGALKMLQRSVQWLYLLPDSCQSIDVAELRRDSYAVRAELQRLGPECLAEFDRTLLKKLRWKPPQSAST